MAFDVISDQPLVNERPTTLKSTSVLLGATNNSGLTVIEPNIRLDVYDHDTTPTTIKAIALDSKTRCVAAAIYNQDNVYDIGSEAKVVLTVLRPDKTGVQITGSTYSYTGEGDATIYGAYAELTQLALAIKGKCAAQFKITNGEQILRTEIFYVNNGQALDADIEEWAGEYDGYNLDELVEKVDTSAAKVDAMETEVSDLKSGLSEMLNAAYITDSASGAIAHFADGADNIPLKSLKVAIKPVQSGTGDPSPDNVRPISGWDSVKVTRAGKNLCAGFADSSMTYSTGLTFTFSDGNHVVITGTTNTTNATSPNKMIGGDSPVPIVLEKDKNYVVSLVGTVSSSDGNAVRLLLQNGETLKWYGDTTTGSWIITPSENMVIDRLRFRITKSNVTVDIDADFQIEIGSEATEFEPYNGETYNVSLATAGTVYGGTLDVTRGELTVDRKMVTVNSSEMPFSFASSYNTNSQYKNAIFGFESPDAKQPAAANVLTNTLCNKFKTLQYNQLASKVNEYSGIAPVDELVSSSAIVRVSFPKSENIITLADANAWLANNPLTVVYELAEPAVYRLTPTEIKSLLGVNNVWSDAGDVDVEYRADTKLYIDKKIQEALML